MDERMRILYDIRALWRFYKVNRYLGNSRYDAASKAAMMLRRAKRYLDLFEGKDRT